jgi:hypothetical protein
VRVIFALDNLAALGWLRAISTERSKFDLGHQRPTASLSWISISFAPIVLVDRVEHVPMAG